MLKSVFFTDDLWNKNCLLVTLELYLVSSSDVSLYREDCAGRSFSRIGNSVVVVYDVIIVIIGNGVFVC